MNTRIRLVTPAHLGQIVSIAPGESVMDFSMFSTLEKPLDLRGYAIKYVFEGIEHYKIGRHSYPVQQAQYLLCAPNLQAQARIDSLSVVKGICVHLNPRLMEEVMAGLQQPDSVFPEPILDHNAYLQETNWVRHRTTQLGTTMAAIGQKINAHPTEVHEVPDGFFFKLAELYLSDYQYFAQQLSAIGATRLSTATDLHRRLMLGRDYMEDGYLQRIGVRDIAQYAMMSEYQFYRLFKSVMGATPYQYLLSKRLQYAWQQLKTGQGTVTEIALKAGFADVFSFSKAFKKHFCTNPTSVLFGSK